MFTSYITGVCRVGISSKSDLVNDVHVVELDSDVSRIIGSRSCEVEEKVGHTRPCVFFLWQDVQQIVGTGQQFSAPLREQVQILSWRDNIQTLTSTLWCSRVKMAKLVMPGISSAPPI